MTLNMFRARRTFVWAGLAGLLSRVPLAFAQSAARRRAIRPEKSPNTGLPYSPGILAGNTLYVSGHLGRDPVSARLVPGGIEAETRQSLANIREVLRAAGMDFKDVVTVTAFIWKSGIIVSSRSSGPKPIQLVICSALARRLPWVSRQPFGLPVVPEV